MTRNGHRPCPGIVLYRADDTVMQDVAVHAAFGMAIVAQRCRNVTLRGSGKASDRTCGVFPSEGRRTALAADATHFSNCRGKILVENCFFRGTVDDALNVHATCLSIEDVPAPDKVSCRYMHGQSFGFETFLPGERMTFIHGPAMQNGPWREVSKVEWISPKEILVTVKGGGLPRVRHHWWTKSGGVTIGIFMTGGNVRLHEPFTDQQTLRWSWVVS